MDACYAVDFGTSNSLLSVCFENGEQKLLNMDPYSKEDSHTLKKYFLHS